ncbi:MAG: hypothetical protein ACYTKD_08345 [Planctomycetota bacterium]
MAKKKKTAKKKPADDDKAKGGAAPADSAKQGGKSKGKGRPGTSRGRRFPVLTLVEVVVAAGVLAILVFLVHWLAAVSIASAVFVFLDATIHHVNRIKPSSEESRAALVAWSMIGFVPFVGVLIYAAMRRKLASAPAAAAATGKEAVDTVKRRMSAVSAPAAIVVAAVAVAITLLTLRGPEMFKIEFGTKFSGALRVEGTTSSDTYTVGTICVKLTSLEPFKGYTVVDWKLFMEGNSFPVSKDAVRVRRDTNNTIWVWKVGVRLPGDYRLDVVDNTGALLKQGYFRAVPRSR